MTRVQSNWLPAGPIQALIREDAERAKAISDSDIPTTGLSLLAETTGFPERAIRRILKQEHVTETMADEYCIKTDRHLWQVYPELYPDTPTDPDEVFVGECRACGFTRLTVVSEGRARLHLVCRECETGQYIEIDPSWRRLPRPSIRVPFPVDEAARLYREGETFAQIAKRYRVSYHTAWRHLSPLVESRSRGGLATGGIERARAAVARRHEKRLRRAAQLRERGFSAREVGVILEVSHRTVYALWREARRGAYVEAA